MKKGKQQQKQRQTVRYWWIAGGIALYIFFAAALLYSYIPDTITVTEGISSVELNVPVKWKRVSNELATSGSAGNATKSRTYQCRLFGLIPVKNVQVVEADERMVYAVGKPVGVYMKMQHVLVVDTKELTDIYGVAREPGKNIVKPGDYILAVNGQEITAKEEIGEILQSCQGEKVILLIRRNGEIMEAAVDPVEVSADYYQLGIWVKDDMAGVGTMTYFDEDGNFGALGHGISDSDTGQLLSMSKGYLYHTTVLDIAKSTVGEPGEVTGAISYGLRNQIGVVEKNSQVGIYGSLTVPAAERWYYRAYPVGYQQEIQRDDASILFAVDGEVQAYKIVIDKIDYHAKEKNKSFVFHVEDERLMEATGGIVQGMSGSPIIQDGKIIGAVTHVLVNQPDTGYGIFIEEMLDAAG